MKIKLPKILKHKKLFFYATRGVVFFAVCLAGVYALSFTKFFGVHYDSADNVIKAEEYKKAIVEPLDIVAYDKKLLAIANNPAPKVLPPISATSTVPEVAPAPTLWPVKTVYPKAGAILPFKRIVAYYGNFYSTKMGVLGEYPEAEMLAKLKQEVKNWEVADPSTPVVPAINYIAITAQGSAGTDGKYRFRMPDDQIDIAVQLADELNGIVILDIQVGLSDLKTELPLLEKYLKMPEVHLAIDPEFSMKSGDKPGRVIGTFDAADVNYAANYLAGLVKANNLPPKILIIHRFTRPMVTNYRQIKPLPEVQIVMDMDGWGFPEKKINTYNQVVYKEPVQFTGFKLFYKNDIRPPSPRMLAPAEILKLNPQPSFIQYQ